MWLAPVKKYFVPFWEIGERADDRSGEFKTRSLNTEGCGNRLV